MIFRKRRKNHVLLRAVAIAVGGVGLLFMLGRELPPARRYLRMMRM